MTAAKTGARTVASDGPHQQLSYHPYLVAFSGRATPATAGLVSRVADALSAEFHVGRSRGPAVNLFDRHYGLLEYDLVLCEGTADPGQPTVRLVDHNGSSDEAPLPPGQIIATVGPGSGITGSQVPHLHPHDAPGLAATIRSHLLALADRGPLYGLVLAGGASRRMGRPKWGLEYHGAPQALHLHQLLEAYCQQVFLSINQEQLQEPALTSRPHLADRFSGVGPLGGILTAMSTHPDAAWLVLACDLPFVRGPTVERLLAQRAHLRFATSYRSPHDALPEPLCTIYEAKARLRLYQLLALGHASPRKLLLNARIELLTNPKEDELVNANNELDYERALARLGPAEAG